MACELDIKTLITQNVKNLFVLRGTGVVNGGTYDADPELVSLLDDIASETGTELYEIFDSGRKIKIGIVVPDTTLRAYGKTAKPSWKTPFEREQAIFDIDHDAVAENIQKLYEKKFREFERLLQDVLLAAQAKVSQLRRSGLADDELANFSRVVAELQENPDAKQRALAVARFVAEAAVYSWLPYSVCRSLSKFANIGRNSSGSRFELSCSIPRRYKSSANFKHFSLTPAIWDSTYSGYVIFS